MIQKDYYDTRPDGVTLYQRTSTLGVKLKQIETNALYDAPIDIDPCPYTYEETDIPIDDSTSEIEQKAQAFDYLTGREERNETTSE